MRPCGRAIMSSMTLAELVFEAGNNRKKAQSAVMFKLKGKVEVATGKPAVAPVPAYNYTSPRPQEPKQCKVGLCRLNSRINRAWFQRFYVNNMITVFNQCGAGGAG